MSTDVLDYSHGSDDDQEYVELRELREMLTKSLDSSGVLGKIKAQLRSSIFAALEKSPSTLGNEESGLPLQNKPLQIYLDSTEGMIAASLVRDWLDTFDLEFTKAVFDPEVNLHSSAYQTRGELTKQLNIPNNSSKRGIPLLDEVLRNSCDVNGREDQELSEHQIKDVRQKFDQCNKDNNGCIGKDQMKDLYMDMFPNFCKNMLERFVADEYKSANSSFINHGVDFGDFLCSYRRFISSCQSVVNASHSPLQIVNPQTVSKKKVGSIQRRIEMSGRGDAVDKDHLRNSKKGANTLGKVADGDYADDTEDSTSATPTPSNQQTSMEEDEGILNEIHGDALGDDEMTTDRTVSEQSVDAPLYYVENVP